MCAAPFPALSLGGTTCEALMSALNFVCSAREGDEIRIAEDMAIPTTAEIEASLLMKSPLTIGFHSAARWPDGYHESQLVVQPAALGAVPRGGCFESIQQACPIAGLYGLDRRGVLGSEGGMYGKEVFGMGRSR